MHKLILAAIFAVAFPALADDAPVAHLRPPADALPMPYTIELQHGATIDFADITQQPPGPLRGYVYVRFQGELVVIPVYRPTDDGTIWRARPAQP